MLQHLRARNRTLFVDVPDDKDGDALPFGQLHQLQRAGAHLRHAARGRFERVLIERLDGVDDQNVGLFFFDGFQHITEAGLGQHVQVVRLHAETVGAQLELTRRFLAGNVQNFRGFTQFSADLQHQRRFADARCTADEHERTLHSAAAEHAVEFAHAGGKTDLLRRVELCDRVRLGAQRAAAATRFCLCTVADGLLDERVPCAAARAAARPFGRFVAALRAEKYTFCLCHIVNLFCFTAAAVKDRTRSQRPVFADIRHFSKAPFRFHCSKIRTRSGSQAR